MLVEAITAVPVPVVRRTLLVPSVRHSLLLLGFQPSACSANFTPACWPLFRWLMLLPAPQQQLSSFDTRHTHTHGGAARRGGGRRQTLTHSLTHTHTFTERPSPLPQQPERSSTQNGGAHRRSGHCSTDSFGLQHFLKQSSRMSEGRCGALACLRPTDRRHRSM